jgi:hypothetical protein
MDCQLFSGRPTTLEALGLAPATSAEEVIVDKHEEAKAMMHFHYRFSETTPTPLPSPELVDGIAGILESRRTGRRFRINHRPPVRMEDKAAPMVTASDGEPETARAIANFINSRRQGRVGADR